MAPDDTHDAIACRALGPWLQGQNISKFAGLASGSHVLEVWLYADSDTPTIRRFEISDAGIETWLRRPAPRRGGQIPYAGLRLIEEHGIDCKGEIPLQEKMIQLLFSEWGLSALETPSIPLYAGGSILSVAETDGKMRISISLSLWSLTCLCRP